MLVCVRARDSRCCDVDSSIPESSSPPGEAPALVMGIIRMELSGDRNELNVLTQVVYRAVQSTRQ